MITFGSVVMDGIMIDAITWLFTLLIRFQLLPMSVLYGVFLFMGISSLKGIQVSN